LGGEAVAPPHSPLIDMVYGMLLQGDVVECKHHNVCVCVCVCVWGGGGDGG
jgi:hypothetical protein